MARNELTLQIVYKWPDGREEVRYERPAESKDAQRFTDEVDELHARAELMGYESPYSYRFR